MKYAYEDLADTQFEALVIAICERLFGFGVQGFDTGPDGGRDGRFEGTAELHPSKASPWSGRTIIQAKHTNGPGKTFADSDFFGKDSTSSVVAKEVPRILALRKAKELDNYILFANRRLSGGMESKLRLHISETCGIATGSVYLAGTQRIEGYLRRFPDAGSNIPLSPMNSPLIISPDELADAVEALAQVWRADGGFVPPEGRVPYEDKNHLNDVDADYAKSWRRRYLKDSRQIQDFLADPMNESARAKYEDAAAEIQLKMLAYRTEGEKFERVIEYVQDLLFERDSLLRSNKRLTKSLLFFMYWSCDIGRNVDDQAS